MIQAMPILAVCWLMNENTLMPQEGFKKHPHHDLELVSYVISGTLKHTDSMGTEQLLEPGTVQSDECGYGSGTLRDQSVSG